MPVTPFIKRTAQTFVLVFILYLPALHAEDLRIAVAANFTGACTELVSKFKLQNIYQVKVSYGSTGKLFAQISHGAPFDIFLAADEARPRRLVEEGLALSASRFTYAKGQLVLWSADENLFEDGIAYLRRGEFRHLAIANPQTAPYGQAAEELLQHLGLWPVISTKLVRGDSIAQTFQFTATGNAEVGLVAASQVRVWPHKGSVWEIPDAYYQPLSQQAVLLKRGEHNLAAQAFMRFLRSTEARGMIRDFGYAVE